MAIANSSAIGLYDEHFCEVFLCLGMGMDFANFSNLEDLTLIETIVIYVCDVLLLFKSSVSSV